MHTIKQYRFLEMQSSAMITKLITVSFQIKVYAVIVDFWYGYYNISGTNMACHRIQNNKC